MRTEIIHEGKKYEAKKINGETCFVPIKEDKFTTENVVFGTRLNIKGMGNTTYLVVKLSTFHDEGQYCIVITKCRNKIMVGCVFQGKIFKDKKELVNFINNPLINNNFIFSFAK